MKWVFECTLCDSSLPGGLSCNSLSSWNLYEASISPPTACRTKAAATQARELLCLHGCEPALPIPFESVTAYAPLHVNPHQAQPHRPDLPFLHSHHQLMLAHHTYKRQLCLHPLMAVVLVFLYVIPAVLPPPPNFVLVPRSDISHQQVVGVGVLWSVKTLRTPLQAPKPWRAAATSRTVAVAASTFAPASGCSHSLRASAAVRCRQQAYVCRFVRRTVLGTGTAKRALFIRVVQALRAIGLVDLVQMC